MMKHATDMVLAIVLVSTGIAWADPSEDAAKHGKKLTEASAV